MENYFTYNRYRSNDWILVNLLNYSTYEYFANEEFHQPAKNIGYIIFKSLTIKFIF